MDTTAFLFSGPTRSLLMPPITDGTAAHSTMASLPFAGRYRLIDFMLSSVASGGIHKVGILSAFGDSELMEHIGSGKDYDLARRSGGIRFYPVEGQTRTQDDRLGALLQIRHAIAMQSEPHVLVADGDLICNLDLSALLHAHRVSGADLTLVVCSRYLSHHRTIHIPAILADVDVSGNVTDLYPQTPAMHGETQSLSHIYVFKRSLLLSLIDEATAHPVSDLHRLLCSRVIGRFTVKAFAYKGFYAKLTDLADYFTVSMALAKDSALRYALFGVSGSPILTRVRNSPPTTYRHSAFVRSSLIADGCVIAGEVENSILFRGVRVERGAVVRNSILLRGTTVSSLSHLSYVISGSDAVLRGELSGAAMLPFYIAAGTRL